MNRLEKIKKRFEMLDKYRLKTSDWGTSEGSRYGFFFIPYKMQKPPLKVMSAPFGDDQEWEHVSVSLPNRCPSWEEMSFIKQLFWCKEDTVIQFHPPESEYVNNHPFCLHLWRNTKNETKCPPSILTGLK
jgi:hypothetical protein